MFMWTLKRISFAASLVCVAVFAAAATNVRAETGSPRGVVEAFHQSLLDVMKQAATLDPRARFQRLETPVGSTFNLPFMIQLASGGKWRTANDAEKSKLVDAFRRVSVGTYAARFDGFSGERFETLGEQDGPGGSRLVLTRIVRPGKDAVPITYVTKKFGADWRVIDVIVSGGISELAVKRSEYNSILNEGGPGELIARLNQAADKMLTN